MDWPIVTLTITLTVTVLGFIWGVIKTFKKPVKDESWKKPLETLAVKIDEKIEKIEEDFGKEVTSINKKLQQNRDKLHDLETHHETVEKKLEELKTDTTKVSEKCDKILEKMIEYLSKD